MLWTFVRVTSCLYLCLSSDVAAASDAAVSASTAATGSIAIFAFTAAATQPATAWPTTAGASDFLNATMRSCAMLCLVVTP